MTSYLLFCTAQVPSAVRELISPSSNAAANRFQTIDALLQAPQHNFFSLVRHPTQSSFDLMYTEPPVAPFDSGFAGYTSPQIREFIAERLPETPPGSDLEPCQYALLDERSVATHSVVLGHSYSTLDMRDPDGMTEDELESWQREMDERDDADDDDADDAWREWRVHFKDAERMSTKLSFEEDFTMQLYNDRFVAAYTDEDGIFDIASAFRAFAGNE